MSQQHALYKYIAAVDPNAARSVIRQLGYKIEDRSLPLSDILEELVAKEGHDALEAIADIHPDKDLILELFSEKCNCSEKAETKKIGEFSNWYGATGENGAIPPVMHPMFYQPQQQQPAKNETLGLCVFAGALVMAASIISVASIAALKKS